MKRFSLIVLLFIGFSFSCLAQPEHRIAFSVGFYNHSFLCAEYESSDHYYNEYEMYDYYSNNDSIICIGNRTEIKSKPLNFNFHYECMLGERAGIGMFLGYCNLRMKQYSETDITIRSSRHESYIHYFGELHRHVISFMPELIVNYIKREHVAIYGKIGVGFSFDFKNDIIYENSQSDGKITMRMNSCFQFTPLSIEVGGVDWRGFAEFGYGYQGVAQVGVKYTFRNKESRAE